MSRFTRIAVCLAGAVLWGAGPRLAHAGDFAFFHENVMGTSLELRVQAVDGACARRAEELVLQRIDRLSRIFSGFDPASEFSRWQTGTKAPTRVSLGALRSLACVGALAGADRRGLRSSGRGAVAAVDGLRPAKPIAGRGRVRLVPGR